MDNSNEFHILHALHFQFEEFLILAAPNFFWDEGGRIIKLFPEKLFHSF